MFAMTESVSADLYDVLFPATGSPFPARLLERTRFDRWAGFPSGRAALAYALRDAGLGPDDEVLTPSYSDLSVDRVVESVATPIHVDVGTGYTMDLDRAEERITDRTRAIVPTHLFGEPCDMERVAELAAEHDLAVIEDAAHALGAMHVNGAIGEYSDYCLFSFRFTKEATIYKGGLLLGADPARMAPPQSDLRTVAALCGVAVGETAMRSLPGPVYSALRSTVLDPYFRTSAGFLDDVTPRRFTDRQHAMLAAQFRELSSAVETRRRHAERYRRGLVDAIERPPAAEDHAYFRYPIQVPRSRREPMANALQRRGIGCSKSYSYVLGPPGECPNAYRASGRVINLPIHARLDAEQVERVIGTVNEVWAGFD
ncbi:DegT/DnrJ/EryC1/StrS aminotransferase family protein [Halalkalicoccus sp. NIPERK01]|uniref:DegT/DnrJ/EryC1/StrS family aminotransferase n=1 Tax=Halalkalicoccus sp. NIPERK01 TaxID=3053469 RepID=UPI00256ED32E|nr:DegT/DnrJ/EryC1/StrS family aminotransferase [Halalkalicoccus sp. NIPERK01]MDL5362200.1 DegT/DnrJ/EryC1/StrS family aminotransferase [Halalkalicoccus sp. NIPERK01]